MGFLEIRVNILPKQTDYQRWDVSTSLDETVYIRKCKHGALGFKKFVLAACNQALWQKSPRLFIKPAPIAALRCSLDLWCKTVFQLTEKTLAKLGSKTTAPMGPLELHLFSKKKVCRIERLEDSWKVRSHAWNRELRSVGYSPSPSELNRVGGGTICSGVLPKSAKAFKSVRSKNLISIQ